MSFTPTLAPMPRGILATVHRPAGRRAPTPATVRAAWEQAYADEPFVHLLPEGQWPRTAATRRAATPSTCRSPSTSAPAGSSSSRRVDNLDKGTAGAAVQCANLALGLPETTGLPVDGSRTVTRVDRPAARLPGGRRRRRAQGQRQPDLALVVNDGPRHAAAAVFTANRVKAAPVLWSRQVVADGRVDAVVLNSGGANACTGAAGLRRHARTAEHVAERARHLAPATSRSAPPA